ncbi:MAG TPA: hypothetical protein VMR16_01400 [Candidatus Saccharimonadales bacterium]|nr:hypothetical protein [Candidatus Saccharimonadales bacterium]
MNEETPRGHVYGPIEPVEQSAKKPAKKLFSRLWKYTKKHKLAVYIVAGILVICAILFVALPVVTIGQYSFVNNNTTTRIELGQTAKLKYANVTVKINKFISNICPTEKCFGSGPVVDYDFIIDGQKYVDTSLTPTVPVYRFQIKTIKTDNKTYADIKIVKS